MHQIYYILLSIICVCCILSPITKAKQTESYMIIWPINGHVEIKAILTLKTMLWPDNIFNHEQRPSFFWSIFHVCKINFKIISSAKSLQSVSCQQNKYDSLRPWYTTIKKSNVQFVNTKNSRFIINTSTVRLEFSRKYFG